VKEGGLMMIDAIELLVSKEKARCGSDDPDFQSMEKALDAIYKIDDKEYDDMKTIKYYIKCESYKYIYSKYT
jgi:hypothetical protein